MVRNLLDLDLVLLILSSLYLLGSSQLETMIRTVGWQGLLLALLPALLHTDDFSVHLAMLSMGTVLIKTILIPWLLRRPLKSTFIHREVEPYVGFTLSLAVGIFFVGFSFWIRSRIPYPAPFLSPFFIPVTVSMVLMGLFLIIARKKAITQVVGYLIIENGIYVLGVSLAVKQPFLVEMGILLDVFAGVFLMGIAFYHIHREFDHIDIDKLHLLRERR